MTFPRALQAPRAACLLAFAAALVVGGCSSSSSDASSDGSSGGTSGACKTGKNAAFADPAGTPFVLPSTLAVEGDMSANAQTHCDSILTFVEYGGDYVPVCVGLKSTTGAEVKLTVPAGLAFVSNDPKADNGMLLQSHELVVPPGSATYFSFRLFSINKSCDVTSLTNTYRFGNVSNDSRIAELITLAAPKKFAIGNDDFGPFVYAMWDITDGDGLTAEDRAKLQ